MYEQGSIVLVPFPFTDLSAIKKRPALVISPDWFNNSHDDVVLIALTSVITEPRDEELEIVLSQGDIISGTIPRTSLVKIAKIFTCHQEIVAKNVAKVNPMKLNEILGKLHSFFQKSMEDD